jgi:hypothetical protein
MALPLTVNTTCDIYRSGNAPPSAPDVPGVVCHLKALFPWGREHAGTSATGGPAEFDHKFDHVLTVDCATDIRDAYDAGTIGSNADTVYIPDKNGTGFKVIYVELHDWGMPSAHKKVFLARLTPTWPTQQV